MEKRAYLVSFVLTTRVVTDANASETTIAETAANKMLIDPAEYINIENLDFVDDDKELPYDPDIDDTWKDIAIRFCSSLGKRDMDIVDAATRMEQFATDHNFTKEQVEDLCNIDAAWMLNQIY